MKNKTNYKTYEEQHLIFQNKIRAKQGIGIQKVTHDPSDTNREYQEFLKKYEKLSTQ